MVQVKKKKNLSPRSLKGKGVHMVMIRGGKGWRLMGLRAEKEPGRKPGKESLYPLGPRSCQGRDQLLSLSQWKVPLDGESDRLEVCNGSFAVSWPGPQGAQMFGQALFCTDVPAQVCFG